MTPPGLLLLPELICTESLRGYMLRAAEENMYPRMFCNEIHSVKATASFAAQMAQRDKPLGEELLRKFAPAMDRLGKASVAVLGDDMISAKCLHARSRQFCPLCLAHDPHSRLEWEVKSVQACPFHKVILVNACPNCDRPLLWHRSALLNCFCGQQLALIEPSDAKRWQKKWAKQVEAAIDTSCMGRRGPETASMSVIPTRLSKLLLMADVVRQVLLPEHFDEKVTQEQLTMMTVRILDDRAYCAFLWDAIFIHAATNPLEMAGHLVAGRRGDAVTASYKDLIDELALPNALCNLTPRRRAKAKHLDGKTFFDVRVHGIGPDRYRATHGLDHTDPFDLFKAPEEQLEEEWS